MAIDLTIFKADREAVRDDIPLVVVSGDETVSCRKSVISDVDRAAAGGVLEDYVFSIYSVTDDWETLPVVGGLLTIADVDYRILRAINDSVGTRFDLGSKYTDRMNSR